MLFSCTQEACERFHISSQPYCNKIIPFHSPDLDDRYRQLTCLYLYQNSCQRTQACMFSFCAAMPLTWHDSEDIHAETLPGAITLRLRRFFLYSDLCHLGNQRSGSGGGPGFSGSKFFGRRVFRFRFRLPAVSPPLALLARTPASPFAMRLIPTSSD